jgi:hypothetical protein
MALPGVRRDDLCAQASMPFVRAYLAYKIAKKVNQIWIQKCRGDNSGIFVSALAVLNKINPFDLDRLLMESYK